MHADNSSVIPPCGSKRELYTRLEAVVRSFVEPPSSMLTPHFNLMIGLSNVSALLFYELNRFANPNAMLSDLPLNWLGFYLLQSPQRLVLGPFQGRPACIEVAMGRGVCGTAAQKGETLIVPDVHAFPGHIACDSLSNSEIVVPIKTAKGHVVGVLDVDSTQREFFDAEDAQGLQNIATVLSQNLEFPMACTLARNPLLANAAFLPSHNEAPFSLAGKDEDKVPTVEEAVGSKAKGAFPPFSATKMAAFVITRAPGTTPATALTEVGEGASTQQRSQRFTHRVGGWDFSVTELSRILTQEELLHYEEALGVSALPEIPFAFNTLRIAPAERADAALVKFSLLEVLRSAAAFYRTDAYCRSTLPQLQIPVADSWKKSPYATVDAKVDWAWRNNYFGVNEWRCKLRPLEPSMPGVNWELLKDQTLPIVFFHNFDIFEDDLHDHGIVKSSVRFRVMSLAFFILFRHFVRVDGYRVWMREVRLFHEFSVKRPDGQPHIVVREEVRILDIADGEKFRNYDPNDCAREATVVEANDFYVSIEDPTYDDWWSTIGVH
ncbi:hypothetical protein ECC02_005432 [Trypanosoma cruzi]|uniref:GAF domain-containing protein n=1 Tax=Trypanosoma cruzi TaxID=5693 RepID=A0A7J6Y4Z7_TRYCR|nr:hypothetical protein ECC02_005432 [Trypanosoma cruzi]